MQDTLICKDPAAVIAVFARNDERLKNEMIKCLYEHFGTDIKNKIVRSYGNRHNENDVEYVKDAFQEALIHLIYQGEKGNLKQAHAQPAVIWSYLFEITKNKYRNEKKKESRRMHLNNPAFKSEMDETGANLPERAEQERLQEKLLAEGYKTLRANCRELLHLVYVQHKKIKDIAVEREQTVDYLYMELSRCRSELKKCVENHPIHPN
jgi:DNA-directed RNA polymerase specialized sigma24 family protein